MGERPHQFQWDEHKAIANENKHGVTFELASTVFYDPNLLTVADVEHSETEERWFSVGTAACCCRWSISGRMPMLPQSRYGSYRPEKQRPLSADNTRKSYE